MTRALGLLALTFVTFALVARPFGLTAAQDIARAAIVLLGLTLSGTFLWLWREKATPLALAMTFSWAGASALLGWWVVYDLWAAPAWMAAHPVLLAILGVYLTGTLLHLQAVRAAFGLGQVALVGLMGGALAAAVMGLAVLG